MPILLSLLFLLAPQSSGGGLDVLRSHPGSPYGLAAIADLDGDGVPDYLIGTSSQIRVHSGATGALLYADQVFGLYGTAPVDLGDLNGDGVHDFATADPTYPLGAFDVHSGADFSVLYVFPSPWFDEGFGCDTAPLGDLDGDGVSDFMVGHYGANMETGAVVAYSGATGTRLFTMDGTEVGARFGSQIEGLGDVTGDGVPDFVVSSPWHDSFMSDSGRVEVFSGATRTVIATLDGFMAMDLFGDQLLVPGDLDGDGLADLVVAASLKDHPIHGLDAGRVRAFSSADWSELWHADGEGLAHYFGSDLGALGDWNGDGVGDLVVGAPGADFGATDTGAVYVLSGADGQVLERLVGDAGDALGTYVAGIGDVVSDALPEFLVSTSTDTLLFGHSPFLFADAAGIRHDVGGIVGLHLDFPGDAGGDDYQVLFSLAGPGSFSYQGLEVPLSVDPLLLRTLYAADYSFLPYSSGMTGTLDAFGDAWATFAHPGGMPAGAVGKTTAVAAIAGPAGQPPSWSSAAVVLVVL